MHASPCDTASEEGDRARKKSVVSEFYTSSSVLPAYIFIPDRVEFVALAMETKAINLGQVRTAYSSCLVQRAVIHLYRACLILLLHNTCWMLCQSVVKRPGTTSTPEVRSVCYYNVSEHN